MSPQHLKYVLSKVLPYNLVVTNYLFCFFFASFFFFNSANEKQYGQQTWCLSPTVEPCGFEFLTGCLEWLGCFSQITKCVEHPGKKINCSGFASLTFTKEHWLMAIAFNFLLKRKYLKSSFFQIYTWTHCKYLLRSQPQYTQLPLWTLFHTDGGKCQVLELNWFQE